MKFKFLLLGFISFLFFVNVSYAQDYRGIGLFEMFKPVYTMHITKEKIAKSSISINPSPNTYITIRQGSFTKDVDLLLYKGYWEALATGKTNYSPVSAYYLAFLDSNKKEVNSINLIEVLYYNNYTGTDATFTPVSKGKGVPDQVSTAIFKNQALVRAVLPQIDGGFIISINKTIDKNDPALNPTLNSKTAPLPTTTNQNSINPLTNFFVSQNIYMILGLVVIIIVILLLVIKLFRRADNKPSIQ